MSVQAKFVFVGEQRSQRAQQMGVTWRDGRLAASTLHAALREAGIDPEAQRFTNVYPDEQREVDPAVLVLVSHLAREGWLVVALGAVAQRELRRAGVPCIPMIHPAARGSIRKTERYQAHVRQTLEAVRG